MFLFHRVQNQVDEVVDIMKDNVEKVLDRGEKLDDLQEKSGRYKSVMFLNNIGVFNVFP